MAVIVLPNKEELNIAVGQPVGNALEQAGVADAIGIKSGAEYYDLQTPLRFEGSAIPVTLRSKEGLEMLRHTAAHVMAQAVSRLFDNVEFAIGPVIDDGFYYDFDRSSISTEAPIS